MLTPEQFGKMISAAQGKTCQLDSARRWSWTSFARCCRRSSPATGCFPERYKHTIITPLSVKSNMDASQLQSYRPFSNLPFLSKLLERAVHSQLQSILDANSAISTRQSAYRKHHSTETELIKVYDDLLKATDNGQMSALWLLDLTAAFDTVNHELLMARLEGTFGVRSRLLAWFKSCSTGRTLFIALCLTRLRLLTG